MKKQLLSLIATMALIQSISVVAREIRAPLPFRNGFQRFEHYPYICENVDQCWDFDVWGGAYHRQAGDGYRKGTNKESLSAIYFGAESFTLAQVLPVGTVVPAALNVLLTPRFNYSENGAMFGFNVNRRFECSNWDIGIRTNIPFRAMGVTLDDCCTLAATGTSVVTPRDLCLINNPAPEEVPTVGAAVDIVPLSYAYRLDCLTALHTVMNPTDAELADGSRDLVKYRLSLVSPNPALPDSFHMAINDKVVDNIVPYPVHVVAVADGQIPTLPFSRPQDTVNALPVLPSNGVIAEGTRAHFQDTQNYTALEADPAQQRRLWVVPTEANGNIITVAGDLRTFVTPFILFDNNDITQALAGESAIDFLNARGVTFDSQRYSGLGDFDLDFYARKSFCDCCYGNWYVEGITGVRFPTAKAQKNPGLLLGQQPLGKNRHFEIKLGAQVGMQPTDWLAVKADAQFYHAFPHTERVAAAFATATVKNIGTPVDAKISWNYFLGNVDLTFLIPCSNTCIGFDVGYQPYYKGKDKVKFSAVTAVDFLGNTQTLSSAILENQTNRLAHRIKSEIFHKNCTWEIYGGWLHTVAGKNIQRETDWYLGFGLFF